MKQICDIEELRKAFEKAELLQYIPIINGEDQKQQDGSWLPSVEFTVKEGVNDITLLAINTVFKQQLARDWASFRIAKTKIRQLEQKCGVFRRDREFILKVFKAGDYQYNAAKIIEDQIDLLRPELIKVVKPASSNTQEVINEEAIAG